jgi:phosphohistidine phosphatase
VAPVVSEVQDESISRQRDPKLMHLVVIRHAKSSWDDPSLADHDRPLSKRGRKALSPLRDHIEGLELRPELVMCSSSRRTCETLAGIRAAFGRKARVETDSSLYAASAEQLVTELRRLDDQVTTVVLIGHNPGVADLVDLLVSASATGEAAIDTFPTAAVAVLSVAGPWSALQPACASLENFWAPRRPR